MSIALDCSSGSLSNGMNLHFSKDDAATVMGGLSALLDDAPRLLNCVRRADEHGAKAKRKSRHPSLRVLS